MADGTSQSQVARYCYCQTGDLLLLLYVVLEYRNAMAATPVDFSALSHEAT